MIIILKWIIDIYIADQNQLKTKPYIRMMNKKIYTYHPFQILIYVTAVIEIQPLGFQLQRKRAINSWKTSTGQSHK